MIIDKNIVVRFYGLFIFEFGNVNYIFFKMIFVVFWEYVYNKYIFIFGGGGLNILNILINFNVKLMNKSKC